MMLRGSLVPRNIIANVAYERRFSFMQNGNCFGFGIGIGIGITVVPFKAPRHGGAVVYRIENTSAHKYAYSNSKKEMETS